MRNFPMHLWKELTQHKEAIAFALWQAPEQGGAPAPQTITYGEWCRTLQRLAIGLIDIGFEPGQRLGLSASNSYHWVSLATATWLAGGCLVPLVPGMERRDTLRAMARSGCDVIATTDVTELDQIRGQGNKLPEHLRWVLLDGTRAPSSEEVVTFDALLSRGKHRELRGGDKQLAERMFKLDPEQPSLILFDPQQSEDPHGAFFKGSRLSRQLSELSDDLRLEPEQRPASVLSYAWPQALLLSFALLWKGHTLIAAPGAKALLEAAPKLRPTMMLVPSSFLEAQGKTWREELERAPEMLKRLTERPEEQRRFGLIEALGVVGERAAERALYEPLRRRLGDALRLVYKVGPALSEGVSELFDRMQIEVLSLHGYPEAGITHMERPGATRRGAVGRPVLGVASKILDGKGEAARGELLIRSENLASGYWDGQGPRSVSQGWLHTGEQARIEGGFLFIEEPLSPKESALNDTSSADTPAPPEEAVSGESREEPQG